MRKVTATFSNRYRLGSAVCTVIHHCHLLKGGIVSIDDQAHVPVFTLFFKSGVGPCDFALRVSNGFSEGSLYVIKMAFKFLRPTSNGKHYFLVYLENNEFCFVEAEKHPSSAEWRITKRSSTLSLEKFSSQIAVCSHLRRDFETWWRQRLNLGWEDIDLIRRLAPLSL